MEKSARVAVPRNLSHTSVEILLYPLDDFREEAVIKLELVCLVTNPLPHFF
jgi:hypothetical protein